jgi:hypothetical protein
MRRYLLSKTLALGVVVLFIGVSVHPAFAVEDKTSTESLTIDFKNESPIIQNNEIYQNANCFVMGAIHLVYELPSEGLGLFFLKGDIAFGEYFVAFEDLHRSFGWISTISKTLKWRFEGTFIGALGTHTFFITNEEFRTYIGIKDFRGINILGLFGPNRIFGYADSVRIKTYPDNIWE